MNDGRKGKPTRETYALARDSLELHGGNQDVVLQVEALVSSVDDTLSDDFILAELSAIKQSGRAFFEVRESAPTEIPASEGKSSSK